MTRLALLPALLLALAACDDFQGDLKRLAFSTNLHVGVSPWTPDHAVAAGSTVQVFPGSILGRETQPEDPVVRGSVKGGVAVANAGDCDRCVRFVGAAGSRARVSYTVDGVYDEFRTRFEPAARFELALADGAADDLAIVEGKVIPFGTLIQDARGRSLGYDPEQVDVTASGPMSAWQDEAVLIVVEADGQAGEAGEIELTYAGKSLGTRTVAIVSADEVVRTEKVCPPRPQACDTFLLASYTADGTRVLGAFDTWEGRPVGVWGEVSAAD